MNRNKTSLFILLAFVVFLPYGCKHKPTLRERGIVLDTLFVDTTAVLNDSAAEAHCAISLSLLTFSNKAYHNINDSLLRSDILSPCYFALGDKSLTPREVVDSFVRRYIDDYRTFYAGIFTDEPNAKTATISFKVETTIEEGKDSTINYLAHISNCQGVVGTDYTVCLNLDLSQQRILRLNDVFVHGAEKGLTDAVVAKLQEQASVKSPEALQQAGFFINSTPYATENFILKDNSVTFVYVMGEIADRSKGEIQVDVKNSEIKNLFKR